MYKPKNARKYLHKPKCVNQLKYTIIDFRFKQKSNNFKLGA